jgi:enoyl-CoA hydratase/carnithine racemase
MGRIGPICPIFFWISPSLRNFTAMQTDSFQYSVENFIARVKFNRPDKLNSLTFKVYRDLTDLMYNLRFDESVRVVMIEGNGRGFCSGGDVHEIIGDLLKRDVKGLLEFTRMTGELVTNMRLLEKPIISSINGIAAGAGAVIALASDFRVFAENAKIAFLFQKVGLTGADMGAVFLLPKVVGLARATEMLMLGDTITSEEAYRVGLANKVVPLEALDEESMRLATRLAESATMSLGLTKRLINNEWHMDLTSAIEQEATAQALMLQSEDHREYHAAFSEKRKPVFKGR